MQRDALLLVRTSDGAQELVTSELPGPSNVIAVQLQWAPHHGKHQLAWVLPSWAGTGATRVHDIDKFGCQVVSLEWTAEPAAPSPQWAPDGQAVCLLCSRALQLWRVGSADSLRLSIVEWSGCRCTCSPCSQLILCMGWVEHSCASVVVFCSSIDGKLVSGQHLSTLGKCVGLAWSSTGIVAFSDRASLYLCTVSAGNQPSLQVQHSLDTRAAVCRLHFACCGWLLAIIDQDSSDAASRAVYLVQTSSGKAVRAAVLENCS